MNDPVDLATFRAGTMDLAREHGYPVVLPSGTFVPDARAAWLVEAVEDWMVAAQKPRVRKGWFSASALGKTDEELIADYRGEPGASHNARTLRVFDLGLDRDRSWKRYLRGAGLSAFSAPQHRKMKIEWLRLQGGCDDIVRNPAGELCVVEFKTKAPYLFSKLEEPDPAHLLQVTAYMSGLRIDQAIILYECKGTQAIKAFYLPLDVDIWGDIVARLGRLRKEAEA